MSINSLDVRHLRADTRADVSAITNIRDGQLTECLENHVLYTFVENGSSLNIDGTKVLSSAFSNNSRWVYSGKFIAFGYSYSFDIPNFIEEDADNYSVILPLDTDPTISTDPLLTSKYIIQLRDSLNNLVDVTSIVIQPDNRAKLIVSKDPDCRFKGTAIFLPTENI